MGLYLWADGLNARGDGLEWPCGYFQSDGTHPAIGARVLVADSLLAFFEHDPTAVPWHSGVTVTSAPLASVGEVPFLVRPNPSSGAAQIIFTPSARAPRCLDVFDLVWCGSARSEAAWGKARARSAAGMAGMRGARA